MEGLGKTKPYLVVMNDTPLFPPKPKESIGIEISYQTRLLRAGSRGVLISHPKRTLYCG